MSHAFPFFFFQLKLELSSLAPSFEPTKVLNLKVIGDPGAKVGLVAVDKGVYVLNNQHRLSQKKAMSYFQS